jgi:predicted Zn-dependent peptidase
MTRALHRPLLLFLGLMVVAAPFALGFDFAELENSVTEHTLENGLKIIIMERHDAPVASFVTFANVGGVDDPKEYTGLAHMLEHMAFKGTRSIGTTDIDQELKAMAVEDSIWYELRAERKKGRQADTTRLEELTKAFDEAIEAANQYVIANAFDHYLEKEGAVGINAGTGKDQTIYISSLPSNKVELWMALESDRFLYPVFREMYREREVIAEERRQVLENNPIMRSIDALVSTAYVAHPYRISIVGHMSDINNYTRDAVKKYFAEHYSPANLILGIVGDVNPKKVIELAEEYWSRIPSTPKPERVATIEPKQTGEKRVSLTDPAQPLFLAGWHVPEETHPDWPALEALADYLGEGRTSLLYKNLVKDKKMAGNVGLFLGWPGTKYPCMMFAYAMPSPEHDNAECEEQVLLEVERMKNELIPAEEVEKIKARAKSDFINNLTSNLGMAIQLAGYENDWGDWRHLFKNLDRINAVTPEDIQRVAQEYLTVENRTVVHLNTSES